jgi:tRNA threonylcarbamoyl adenosine modification protein YeaZ
LKELLHEVDWCVESINLVVVAVGPGSFTGLRIGVTTAKTLAYAVGAEVIGVNTLAVIASQAPRSDTPLWVVIDAQRGELFAAKFDAERKLIGETQEPTHLSSLFVGKKAIILAPLDPESGVHNVLVDALYAVAVQVEHLHLVPRIPENVFRQELSAERKDT